MPDNFHLLLGWAAIGSNIDILTPHVSHRTKAKIL
jgi:hypothetical protein